MFENDNDLTTEERAIYREMLRQHLRPVTMHVTSRHDLDDDEAYEGPGWYCRLSADGYLDCTEWEGCFKTENGAMHHLIDTYGSDQ